MDTYFEQLRQLVANGSINWQSERQVNQAEAISSTTDQVGFDRH